MTALNRQTRGRDGRRGTHAAYSHNIGTRGGRIGRPTTGVTFLMAICADLANLHAVDDNVAPFTTNPSRDILDGRNLFSQLFHFSPPCSCFCVADIQTRDNDPMHATAGRYQYIYHYILLRAPVPTTRP